MMLPVARSVTREPIDNAKLSGSNPFKLAAESGGLLNAVRASSIKDESWDYSKPISGCPCEAA
jgi:hypothetical protein